MDKISDQPFGRIARDCRDADVPFPKALVEKFERVAKKLNEDWGKPAAADFLNDLLFPSRPDRQGFPPDVAEEILTIKNLHEERYAHLFAGGAWDPTRTPHGVGVGSLQAKAAQKAEEEERQARPTQKAPSIYSTRKATSTDTGADLSGEIGDETDAEVLDSAETTAPLAPNPETAPASNGSAAIARLMPAPVRKQLQAINHASPATLSKLPPPPSELEEMLIDAERHFDEEHLHSGTALLEQLTTIFPTVSPYAYLRLMEMYVQMQRREDYEWVSKRFSEQFGAPELGWKPDADTIMKSLDRLAEAIHAKLG